MIYIMPTLVVADLEIVCRPNIKFCREDRIVDNEDELYLAEERSVGSTNGVRVNCSVSCDSFLRPGSSDVISQAGRRRSTSSRGAEKDCVKRPHCGCSRLRNSL